MNIGEKVYVPKSTWGPCAISDDFVDKLNKIGAGNGATRLYLGRDDDAVLREHFGSQLFTNRCLMLREDLLEFFDLMKDEYQKPTQQYRNSSYLPKLWSDRHNLISELPDLIFFDINEQEPSDGRCYVKGTDFFELLRQLPLPRRAEVSFTKLMGEDDEVIQLVSLLPKTSASTVRFWQVQHGTTGDEAELLGLLWSPKKKPKNGHSSKWYDNMTKVREGDRIFSYRDGKIGAVGQVVASAVSAPSPFSEKSNDEDGWLVKTEFTQLPIPFSPTDEYEKLEPILTNEDKKSVRAPGETAIIGYLKEISRELAEMYVELGGGVINLEPIIDDDEESVGRNQLIDLAKQLLLPPKFLMEIDELLEDKRQVIFYGPPGAGKTFVALKLAEALSQQNQDQNPVELVQFHPSYSYEDFVEGFRPTETGNFVLKQGKLLSIAERAKNNPDTRFFLIIDEINRGNVAKIFGEMYFLLEYRDYEIQLQYSDLAFRMPRNLYFIGTMNSADRSIGLIDSALRRRFHFVSFYPTEIEMKDLLRNWLKQNAPDVEWVADVVDRVNGEIDRNFAVGPSNFMKPNLDEALVKKIWNRSVLPYLEDIFFNQESKVKEYELDRLRALQRLRQDNIEGADENQDDASAAS